MNYMKELLGSLTIDDYQNIVLFLVGVIPLVFVATYKYLGNHIGYKKEKYKDRIAELESDIVNLKSSGEGAKEMLCSELYELLAKYQPSKGQIKDLHLFLDGKLNIMDPAQLAESQLRYNQIHVIAPIPLETSSKLVQDSTVKWIKKHLNEEDAFIEYWVTHQYFEKWQENDKSSSLGILDILPDILADIEDTENALSKIKIVSVPMELLFIDFTLWAKRDGTVIAFANNKDRDGSNYILWELYNLTSKKIHKVITDIRKNSSPKRIDIPIGKRTYKLDYYYVSHVPAETLQKLR